MAAQCKHCDGTGSACNACNAGIMDCNCGPDAEPTMCDKCAGTGDMSDEDMAAQNEEIEKSERYGT